MDSAQAMRRLSRPLIRFSTTQYFPCCSFCRRRRRLRHFSSSWSSWVRGDSHKGSSVLGLNGLSTTAACGATRWLSWCLCKSAANFWVSLKLRSTRQMTNTTSSKRNKLRLLTCTAMDVESLKLLEQKHATNSSAQLLQRSLLLQLAHIYVENQKCI